MGNRSRAGWRILSSAAVAILACLVTVDRAEASEPIVVRGEMARLLRQAYDYQYRNSNRNVFRSSNHYHPTKNIFRSSNHYKRKLAASFDGYPLRTFVRYASHHDGGTREHVYSFAHHRRQPYGPGGREYGWWGPGVSSGDLARIMIEQDATGEDRFGANAPAPPQLPQRRKPRSRWEIETIPINIVEREPTQRAVMKTISLADGTTRMIITSEPIERTIEDAWALLARGEHERAAELFAAHSLDEIEAAEATLGYGLARALAGDEIAAARAIRRAQADDPDVPAQIAVDPALRDAIRRIEQRCAEDPEAETNRREAASLIRSTCRALLDRDGPENRVAER